MAIEMQLFQVSIEGTGFVTSVTPEELGDLFDPLGAVRRRGMEPIRLPAERFLLRAARRAGKLQVEPSFT